MFHSKNSLAAVNFSLLNSLQVCYNFTSRDFGVQFVIMSCLVSTFHDAAVSPEAWPQALKALTDAAGVAGAALIIFNQSTGNVDEACFSGLSAEFKPTSGTTPLWTPTRRCSTEAG
jgi:hypothetical protein